jgi:O-antigen/teichoic acid export membrane protein
MRRTIRKLGTFGDVAASGVLVGVTTLVNFGSTLVLARSFGPAAFGLYSTCRRVVAFVAPFANLGGHLGVSRYLGYYTHESRRRSAVLALALVLCVVSLPITMGIILPLQRWAGGIAWIRGIGTSVWITTVALTAATAAGLVVFSALRGFGHPEVANLHQLAVLSSYLLLGIVLWGFPVGKLLALFAGATAAINCFFLGWVVRAHRAELGRPDRAELRAAARDLARFSLTRLADGPLQASLSLIGVLLAPSVGGLELSGYIHISQTLVRLTEILIVPLSVIFLPLVARQVREGQTERLHHQAQLIFDGVLLVGCMVTAQGLVWSGQLLRTAFGPTYAEATPYLLATLPAIPPFLLFAGFRSFIDGYSVRPVNCLNLLVASLVVLVLHFGVRVATRHTRDALWLAAGGALVSYPGAQWSARLGPAGTFLCFVFTLLVTGTLAAAVAFRLGHPTVRYAAARLNAARGSDARLRDARPACSEPADVEAGAGAGSVATSTAPVR